MNRSFVILFIFLVLTLNIMAQIDPSHYISNIRCSYKNEKVEILYDISGANSSDVFNISVFVLTSSGNLLNFVHSLEGDIGKVSSNGTKRIIWDSRSDGYIIDENITIKIGVTKRFNIPEGKHIIKSTLIPGLGDYKIRNGKHYFTYGIIGYGSIAGSIALNRLAYSTYNNYLGSMEIDNRNNYYKTFKTQRTMSYVLVGTAIATWIADVYFLNRKLNKTKGKDITPEISTYYSQISQKQYFVSSPTYYLITKNPYDYAIEKGDKLRTQELYENARIAYNEALLYVKDDKVAKTKINEVTSIIKANIERDKLYKSYISKGDSLYYIKQYEQSLFCFQQSVSIKNKDQYSINKVKEIGGIINKQKIEIKYNELIQKAQNDFKNKNYENAKNIYTEALNLKPNEKIPYEQIANIETIIEKQEKERIDKEFNLLLTTGEQAYRKGNYDEALSNYTKASQLKPDDNGVKQRISIVESKLNIYPFDAWSDWETLYEKNGLKVEIQFKISSTSCNNGKTNKFQYQVSGRLPYGNKYLKWNMDFIDCNGMLRTSTWSLSVGYNNGVTEQEVSSMDYTFTGNKISKAFYNVKITDY